MFDVRFTLPGCEILWFIPLRVIETKDQLKFHHGVLCLGDKSKPSLDYKEIWVFFSVHSLLLKCTARKTAFTAGISYYGCIWFGWLMLKCLPHVMCLFRGERHHGFLCGGGWGVGVAFIGRVDIGKINCSETECIGHIMVSSWYLKLCLCWFVS